MSLWLLDAPPPACDVRLSYGPGEFQFGDLWLPSGDGPHPVVVAIHGGYWRARYGLAYFAHACADLRARGFAVFSIEYRRIGHEGGGFPGTLDDVGRGADFLACLGARFPLDLHRVVAFGHSAGGQLALWLAGRHRLPQASALRPRAPLALRGVIALAAVSDLVRGHSLQLGDGVIDAFMGGSPASEPTRYAEASPAALLPLGVEQAFVHGALDDTVPVAMSAEYAARARELGDTVALDVLADAGHFEIVDPTSHAWPVVVRAVERLTARRDER